MLAPLYAPYPLHLRQAKGLWISCDEGLYLDGFSGIGVLPLGHCHPDVVAAVQEKIERYAHVSNFFVDDDASVLAEELLSRDGREGEVFFTNSGAESTEGALKAVLCAEGEGDLAAFEGAFHGRTLGALSLTDGSARKGFEKALLPLRRLPFTAEGIMSAAQKGPLKALFFETVQGSGGLHTLTKEMAEALAWLQKEGTLLVADEVQCGLGRTGSFYAYQAFGLKPDLVLLAKGLGGGLPLGAVLCFGRARLKAGQQGSTFAPNPLSAAAGLATLRALDDALLTQVQRQGKALADALSQEGEVRGLGLMLGAVEGDPSAIKKLCFDQKLLVSTASDTVRFLPALTLSDEEREELVARYFRAKRLYY